MKRYIQSKIAGSRYTLPIALIYGTIIWLLSGLFQHQWWVQFGCFLVAVWLMTELNNRNVLIRIFSRFIATSFIVIYCAAGFLFKSRADNFAMLCFLLALLFLYDCYLDKTTRGRTFYCFLFLGLGSVANVNMLLYVPLAWTMMAAFIYSMSWRTLWASLLGLVTPYWFMACWVLYQHSGDMTPFIAHFTQLEHMVHICDYSSLPLYHLVFFASVVILWVIGTIHFLRQSYQDKIRVRQIYYSMMVMGAYALLLLALLPQDESLHGRIFIIATCCLYGHFAALTKTKFTNIVFCIIGILYILLTISSLWMPSFLS